MRPLLGVAPPLRVVTGPLAVLFAVLTRLGDLWFLFALVVALLAGAIAVLETLKPLFGVPRPAGFDAAPVAAFLPEILRPLYAWMATASGYGFPSGHDVASTIVWGGLVWAVRVGRRRTRVAVAAGLAALVSASRVLLGVHLPVADAIVVSPFAVTASVAVPTWAVATAAAVGGGLLLALPLVGERVGPALAGHRENSVERA